LSGIVESGYWAVDVGAIRKSDLSDYFSFSETDTIEIFAEGSIYGTNFLSTTIGSPDASIKMPDIVLQPDHILKVNINGSGSVTKNPDFSSYRHGERVSVTLTAIPDAHYQFISWSGDITSTVNPVSVLMDSNKTIAANFATGTFTLTVNQPSNGSISPSTGSYAYGSDVVLTATPLPGYHFVRWTGDATGTQNPTTIHVDSNKTLSCIFEINTYSLNLQTSGSGSVKKSPDQELYNYGTSVQITAIPVNGWSFVNWSGDINGSENPKTIVMDGNKTITANFLINMYSLTTNVVSGSGSISRQPDQASYAYGTSVSLTAIPSAHYHFISWSGDVSGSVNPQSIVMDSNKNVGASFAVDTYTLSVSQPDNGLISPSGGTYDYGSSVKLVCIPSPHYHFVRWTGDAIGTETSITITMDGNKNISAICAIDTHTVSIIIQGQGTVNLDPASGLYPYGSSVTLTAIPDSDYIFVNWAGDITSTDNPKTILITGDLSIIATFSTTNVIYLSNGWNLISLPVNIGTDLKASSITGEIISKGGNCTEIVKWINNAWKGYIVGVPVNDFSVDAGKGYFVRMENTFLWNIFGKDITEIVIPLTSGWNLVGIPSAMLPEGYTAQKMIDEINLQGGDCVEVVRWRNGMWDSHIDEIPFNDFSINSGKGYFVRCLTASSWIPGSNTGPAMINPVISNITDTSFVVSWTTSSSQTGYISYGTAPAVLNMNSYDKRGTGISSTTHYIVVSGLSPLTTYYFDIICGGTIFNNNGNHFSITTGPTLGLPSPDNVFGQVYKPGGTIYAEGTIVYLTIKDNDGSGSPGQSQKLSSIVDENGYWVVNLSTARFQDLSGYFIYSSTDIIEINADGAVDGTSNKSINVKNAKPSPVMILQ